VAHWVRADERGADCAIVFDSGMVDERTPAITIGLRGMVMLHLRVRTAERDLHSGVYGGSALNALHALHLALSAVVPGPDGRLRDELLAGAAAPAQAERDSWRKLPPGDEVLKAAGARPAYPGAGEEYYERNGAQPSLEINAIHAGEHRTVVPATAHASVSQRLAPGQSAEAAHATLERLLREALPPGAELEIEAEVGEPSLFPPDDPAVALAAQALERAVGAPTAFVRTGGSIPVVAELAARGITAVVSGFGLEDDAYHAPDESFRLVALEQGATAADELYRALATL
jgi:acetylornithine deacetylase/succinyl-diaminopimelate desuccinylase-like protein